MPVGFLLKGFLEVSDRELSEKLMACCAEVWSSHTIRSIILFIATLYGSHGFVCQASQTYQSITILDI